MNIKILFIPLLLVGLIVGHPADSQKTYHVAINGNNRHHRSKSKPLQTISAAANLVMPGDTVIVHGGIYREQVTLKRGGESINKRIVFMAAPEEKVEIKGSEHIRGWQKLANGTWMVAVPDTFFGKYNPYTDLIRGDWYFGKGLHTGEIYLGGKTLHEVTALEKLTESSHTDDPVGVDPAKVLDGTYTWYTTHDNGQTLLYANFHEHDPNIELVEINVRPTCFYPAKTGINYITVKGFEMSQAATQWAAPTAEQVGIIGTNWSKGWIIEDNIIHDSKCVGITLGKDRASGQNVWLQNPSKDGSVLYNEMVHRVINEGWNKDNIGSHLVKDNTIYNCGAAGICGSFGAAYSQIIRNNIYDIYTYRPWWGAEMGGIKIHAAIDVLIKDNRVHNTYQGIWLDWMAQGTRVSGNCLYDNDYVDFFVEVDHGPYLVDNNLLLSGFSIKDWSEGGAYAYNLVAGMISRAPQERETPWFKPHSTVWSGIKNIRGGDNRFYHNIFVGTGGKPKFQKTKYMADDAIDSLCGYGLDIYNDAAQPVHAAKNIYLSGANNLDGETGFIRDTTFNPAIRLSRDKGELFVEFNTSDWFAPTRYDDITTDMLGKTLVSCAGFEDADGRPLTIAPAPGLFTIPGNGIKKIRIQ